MLLNRGTYNNVRLLSKSVVETMTIDHLTQTQKTGSPILSNFWDNYGWGLGVSVVTRRINSGPTVGSFGWEGGFGTFWYSDPNENMTAILMTQVAAPPFSEGIEAEFFSLAYQAIQE
jgi:CubicO group peptidase (beta-lactamase class C family)